MKKNDWVIIVTLNILISSLVVVVFLNGINSEAKVNCEGFHGDEVSVRLGDVMSLPECVKGKTISVFGYIYNENGSVSLYENPTAFKFQDFARGILLLPDEDRQYGGFHATDFNQGQPVFVLGMPSSPGVISEISKIIKIDHSDEENPVDLE